MNDYILKKKNELSKIKDDKKQKKEIKQIREDLKNTRIAIKKLQEENKINRTYIKIKLLSIHKHTEKTKSKSKMTKQDYLIAIKQLYPYYVNLQSYSIDELKKIYNKVCNTINLKYDNNNSCYIDSFLVSLFNSKNEKIEKLILKASINKYDKAPELYKLATDIQKELNNIYKELSLQKPAGKKQKCNDLRKLLQKYYNIYKKKINPKYDELNWTNEQNDYGDIFTLLTVMFNIKNTLKYKMNDRIENRTFFDYLSIDNLMNNSQLKIKDYYPRYTKNIELDSGIIRKEKIEYLESNMLFIHINRLLGSDSNKIKLSTPVIPALKLKLKNNKLNLYLNSIIIHIGEAYGGHYICLYECKGIWYEFDDLMDTVTIIGSFEDIIKNYDYISNISGLYYI